MISTTRFALQVLITFGFFETTLAQKDIPGATFPIYEVGDSITTCESNFKNLLNNWTEKNIANAGEYGFFDYSFVETITDSAKFNYYRNYFSGIEPVYSAIRNMFEEDSKGLKRSGFFIRPGFIHHEIYDTRGLTESAKMILTEDFRQKAKRILTQDFNIDTMNLNYYSCEYSRIDTIVELGPSFNSYGTERHYSSYNAASPDSISKNYIDIIIKKERKAEELSICELRNLLLEQILIERVNCQLFFNEQVSIGDKVYLIKFAYNGKFYSNYVVCSAESKKVIVDYFFKGIMIEND